MTEPTEPDDLAARQRSALDRLRPPCCRESDHPDGCEQHRQAARVVGHAGIRLRQPSAGGRVMGDRGKTKPAEDRP